MKVKTWKQKDGSEILISTMTDGHLLNALRMLDRNYPGDVAVSLSLALSIDSGLGGLNPDSMAYDAAMEEACRALDPDYGQDPGDEQAENGYREVWCPAWPALEEEAKRRGIS